MSGYTSSGATFSPCGLYRYALWREWSGPRRTFVVIGLNPSTADAEQDDPTIRRCVGFARRENCNRLLMLNLFAWRSTDPRALDAVADPVGPDNDSWIRMWAEDADVLVGAWGAHRAADMRANKVIRQSPGMRCFGFTKRGHPRHPLYLRADTPLVPIRSAP